MSKVAVRASYMRWVLLGAALLCAAVLSACGGTASTPPTVQPTVQGVAMPSSVSVVTATNAG